MFRLLSFFCYLLRICIHVVQDIRLLTFDTSEPVLHGHLLLLATTYNHVNKSL